MLGHTEQGQFFLSRGKEDTTTAYGQVLPHGTVFFLRQDFNTVENPFAFSTTDPISAMPRAGVHFIGSSISGRIFSKC
jgi:hypothetical protein